jgi:hypothetical protein
MPFQAKSWMPGSRLWLAMTRCHNLPAFWAIVTIMQIFWADADCTANGKATRSGIPILGIHLARVLSCQHRPDVLAAEDMPVGMSDDSLTGPHRRNRRESSGQVPRLLIVQSHAAWPKIHRNKATLLEE